MPLSKIHLLWAALMLCALAGSAVATTSSSDTWEGKYECDVLPTQDGWIAKTAGADGYAGVKDGRLTINTLGTGQLPYWLKEWNFDVMHGASVEWRLRIRQTEAGDASTGTVLGVRSVTGSKLNDFVAISVGETAVHCREFSLKMDTADRFHIYRLTLEPGGYKLYIDNHPRPVTSGPLKAADGSNPDRGIQFGDHSPTADAAYEIDYIRWTTAGAFVPDAALAAASSSTQPAERLDEPGLRGLASEGNLIVALPAADQPPVADGVIRDGEYTLAGTGFIDVVSGQYASQQSRYFLSHDQQALYVAIRSPIPGKLLAQATRRDDSTVCLDDSMEIFIIPGADISPIFQIISNSTGTLFDQKDSDVAWNIKNSVIRHNVSNGVWTMEARIPFSDLGANAPRPGDIWRVNLCRTYGGSSPLYTSMSPTRHSYLSPRQFAYIRFAKEGPSVDLKSIGDLPDRKVDLDFALMNKSGSNSSIDVQVNLKHEGQTTTLVTKRFAAGEPVRVPLKRTDLADSGELAVVSSSPEEGMIFAATYPFAVSKDKFHQNYIYTDLKTRQLKVGVHVPLRNLTGGGIKGMLKLSLGKKLAAEQSFTATAPDVEVSVDIRDLPPGDYDTEVVFDPPGSTEPVVLRDTYRRYADGPPPWEGNPAGLTDAVPAPWTDIVLDGDKAGIWDRTYDFTGQLLTAQITSRNRSVLRAPMAIVTSVNGKSESPAGLQSKWVKQSASRVERAATAGYGPMKVSTNVQVDFDGFTWVRLTLESERPVTVDNLHIDIPLDRRFVTLRNLGDYRMERTGALPAESFGKDLREKPIFWLGDESGGLQWFAESMPGWNCANWAESLRVINEAGSDRVIARLNVIDSPLKLEGRRVIEFGFMATPVKPVHEGFRKFRVAPSGSPAAYNWYIWFTQWTRWVNYPDPSVVVPEKMDLLKAFHKNGVRVTPYMTLGMTTPFSPEFKFYGDDWLIKPVKLIRRMDNPFDPQWDIWAYYLVCNNSASYRDFFAQKMDDMLSRMETDGIYFDYGTSRLCDNEMHGCGWTDNTGQKQRTYNILGTREMARRAYVIIHKRATKDPWIIHHMSGEVDMPANSFCDIMLTGENMTGALMTNENYYKALPLDKFRAEFMGAPWGPLVMDLPQFERAMHVASPGRVKFYSTPEGQKPLEHLIGMTVVNDSLIWPSEGIRPDRLWKVEDEFGWDSQVEFFPYWNNSNYISFTDPLPDDVVVSIFRRKDKLMVVPFNNTDQAVTIRAKINLAALGFADAGPEIKDMYFDRAFTQQDGRVEIPVDPRSFRMIILTKDAR